MIGVAHCPGLSQQSGSFKQSHLSLRTEKQGNRHRIILLANESHHCFNRSQSTDCITFVILRDSDVEGQTSFRPIVLSTKSSFPPTDAETGTSVMQTRIGTQLHAWTLSNCVAGEVQASRFRASRQPRLRFRCCSTRIQFISELHHTQLRAWTRLQG